MKFKCRGPKSLTKSIFGSLQDGIADPKAHTLCRSLISVCTMLSFSKEVKCGLCPDAAWRPPGLLRGCSALPSASHLDGQGDRGLRQRHVSVGETETAMPKHKPEQRLLHRREGLNLCIQLVRHHPPHPQPPADPAPRRHLKQTLNCAFLSCLLLWCW